MLQTKNINNFKRLITTLILMKKLICYFIIAISFNYSFSQDYFLENFGPYDENIQSPEEFLGYEIGDQHTRHDLILAYFKLSLIHI